MTDDEGHHQAVRELIEQASDSEIQRRQKYDDSDAYLHGVEVGIEVAAKFFEGNHEIQKYRPDFDSEQAREHKEDMTPQTAKLIMLGSHIILDFAD